MLQKSLFTSFAIMAFSTLSAPASGQVDPGGRRRAVRAGLVARLAGQEGRVEVGERPDLLQLGVGQGAVTGFAGRAAVVRVGLEPAVDAVVVADGGPGRAGGHPGGLVLAKGRGLHVALPVHEPLRHVRREEHRAD